MSQPVIFISYSRQDQQLADDIRWSLTDAGYTIFMDAICIAPGEHWDRAIHDALVASTHLVLLHTQNSFDSKNVWDEWSYCLSRGKPVIPLIFDDTELPYRLERVQWIDFRGNLDRAERHLLRILPPSGATEPAPVARVRTK